jgi:hypothetical protein
MKRDEALAAPLAGPAGESGEAGEAISALMMRRWPKKSALAKKEKPARWPAYKSQLNS